MMYTMHKCECGYESNAKFNIKRHQRSKTHELNMLCPGENMVANEIGEFTCDICNYVTSRKGHFRDHVLSKKHVAAKAAQIYAPSVSDPISLAPSESITPVILKEIMEMFMTHQKHQQTEILNQHTVVLKTLADCITITTQNTTGTQNTGQNLALGNSNVITNTNNQKFNLNLFLNEECKNAMNMNEFIQRVNITSEDLEQLGEVGYTEGMSKILIKAMRGIETTERPMHCTDVKRDTIYVRKDDAWKKDEDCEETKRLIQHISHKNYKALSSWREEHPEHVEPDTPDYEAWYNISRNMCNTDPSALKKLIRHLALTTAVEKHGLISN